MSEHSRYQSPLGARYASPAMQRLWSAEHRVELWRRLWLALAESQRVLGVDIPEQALADMRAHLDDVDFDMVRQFEQRFRHDVMAHIHAFGQQAPAARPFLHLGATSAFVTDNADLILMRDALHLILGRLVAVLQALTAFATRHRALPTVAYTHFQPAQLTTVGKRATLWLQDFLSDAETIRDSARWLPFRGCKGTTGTQASYLELFDGDHDKVRALESSVAAAFGFEHVLPVSGQTYTRKIDSRMLETLSGIAQSASKYGTDIRLLQHERELFEPMESEQVGSSAMPYKQNPMRAERICSLARHLISLHANAAHTAATQWLERSLDDSANRRLTLPEAFLATDAILVLCTNTSAGLRINQAVIERHVDEVMPFMATERWMLKAVERGGDRQTIHGIIQHHSREVSASVDSGGENDLLTRLANDPALHMLDVNTLRAELKPELYIGRAPQQVDDFVEGPVQHLLDDLTSFHPPDEASITV